MTNATRLIRGPPSPPQSTDGYLAPDVSQEPGDYPVMYGFQAAYAGAVPTNDTSFDEHSSLKMYINTTEYAQNVPLQQTMAPSSAQVNTPPDESFASGGEPTSWPSPAQRRTTPRARVPNKTRQRRRGRGTQAKEDDTDLRFAEPLSMLTANLTHIPIKDIETQVNRSTAERIAEVTKKKKIPRSSNSFMLYRSAYADRCKAYFANQNHQHVSRIAGKSWAIETPEIRELYTRLAEIEKANQKLAFPEYRYVPKKKAASRNRSRRTPSGSPSLQNTSVYSSPEIDQYGWGSGHSAASTPFDDMVDHGLPNDGYFPPTHDPQPLYPTSHPTRPHSAMNYPQEHIQYFQPHVHPGLVGYQVENVQAPSSLAGLPGGAHHDLLQPQTQPLPAENYANAPVDPRLLLCQGAHSGQDEKWQMSPTNTYFPTGPREPSPDQYAALSSTQPVMQALDQIQMPDSAGHEFERYFNDTSPGYQ
ncbi:hypothetical protein BJX70DRAFT_347924 [Aspergillus crustosus]